MTSEDFETLCRALYRMTDNQRQILVSLARSRVWDYEAGDPGFEGLNELDDESLKALLKRIRIPMLAIALKGASADLRHKIRRRVLSKAKDVQLVAAMEALGPMRVSVVESAQNEIMSTFADPEANKKIDTAAIRVLKSFPKSEDPPIQDETCRQTILSAFAFDELAISGLVDRLDARTIADFIGYAGSYHLARKFILGYSWSLHDRRKELFEELAVRWPSFFCVDQIQQDGLNFAVPRPHSGFDRRDAGRKAVRRIRETIEELRSEGMCGI